MTGAVSPEQNIRGVEFSNPLSKVVIIDSQAQTADLLYWAVVEAGFRADLIPFDSTNLPVDYIQTKEAMILSGGKQSVNDAGSPQIPEALLDLPTFGVCYGGQALAKAHGGVVSRVEIGGHDRGEFSTVEITVDPAAIIYGGIDKATVRMSHHDSITQVPAGFHQTGWSGDILASFESSDGKTVATQFHPEVNETVDGGNMLRRWLTESVGLVPDPEYTVDVALDELMQHEEAHVASLLSDGHEIRGFLSGGVDSMVAASLIVKVAREVDRLNQVKFYYVDTGHNRIEDDTVIEEMVAHGMPVEKIDAREDFFHGRVTVQLKEGAPFLAPPLVEAEDPELKRAIIGTAFNALSGSIIKEAQGSTDKRVYFMQGTNASDITESREVKSHHNVNAMEGLRQDGTLIEPLRHLLKYHVRLLAEKRYGLPEKFAKRPPFPGVGMSPRIVVNLSGELPPSDPALQRRIDDMIASKASGQLVGNLVKVKTVGVKGDSRSLADAVLLGGDRLWQTIESVTTEVTDHLDSVNRVFHVADDFRRKDIQGTVTRDDERFMEQLRRIEEIHRESMVELGLDPYISQHFVGTLPIDVHGSGLPLLGVRLFITGDKLTSMEKRRTGASKETFRTGVAAIPGVHIDEDAFNKHIERLLESLRHHGTVAYDVTPKSPGSTEWE